MSKLTPMQHNVLTIVMLSWIKRGKPPTDKEISERVTTTTVKRHVLNLQRGIYILSDGHRRILRDVQGNRVRMHCRLEAIDQGILDGTGS